ncbi:MAG: hypothetical protein ACLQUY_16090 [Ktedonobacterales bacterium]
MRISDNVKHCAGLVCTREGDEHGDQFYRYRGTAFFLRMGHQPPSEQGFLYLVTAKHNVLAAQREGKALWLRINTQLGKAAYFSLLERHWHFSDDPEVDAAVLLCPAFKDFEYQAIPFENCATSDDIASLGIGIGDQLFIVGMFANQEGTQRNMPIMRSGNIAAMPGEPLYDRETGLPYSAYLAETSSDGGLSGSPVFVSVDHGRDISRITEKIRVRLLGLMRGPWYRDQSTSPFQMESQEVANISSGIATVTPIREVIKLLNQDEPVEERRMAGSV